MSDVFTTLDDPSATFGTQAYGINNFDQIVGYWVDGTGHKNGFLWSGGGYTTIDDLQVVPGTNNRSFSDTAPQGINDAGQIVGFLNTTVGGGTVDFLYSGGSFSFLNNFPFGNTNTIAAEEINHNARIQFHVSFTW